MKRLNIFQIHTVSLLLYDVHNGFKYPGLRTNHYNEKYHTAPSRAASSVPPTAAPTPTSPSTPQTASNSTSTPTPNPSVLKKATFIGCDYKLENSNLYSEWQLLVITGRKQAYDGPDSSFWIGTKTKSIRKIGGIRGSVPRSCLYSIGSDANAKENKYCAGKISRVLIFDGVLAKPDIQKLYAATFRIDDDQIRSLLPKSSKWHSLSKRKRHLRSHYHSNPRKAQKSKDSKESKESDPSFLSTPTKPRTVSVHGKRSKSSSPPSMASSSVASSIPNTPITSPISTEKHDSTQSTPVLVNTASGHSDDLSAKRHSESASSFQMDAMDEELQQQIAKQAVIDENGENERESSTSSSDREPGAPDQEEAEEENKENINDTDTSSDNKVNAKDASNISNVDENAVNGVHEVNAVNGLSEEAPGTTSTSPTIRPKEAVEMDVERCPHHEKLLPQLEADILEQQKMMEEQRERDKLNEGNVLNKFLKSMRNLTNGTLLEDEEDDMDHVVKVIPIDHRGRPNSVRQSDNDGIEGTEKEYGASSRMVDDNGDIESIQIDHNGNNNNEMKNGNVSGSSRMDESSSSDKQN